MTNDYGRDSRPQAGGKRFAAPQQQRTSASQRSAGTRFASNAKPKTGGSAQGQRFAPKSQPGARQRTSQGAQRPASVRTVSRSAASNQRYRSSGTRRAPQAKKSPVPIIIGVVLGLAMVLAIVFVAIPAVTGLFGQSQTTIEAGKTVTVEIPEGASGDQIAKALTDAGVIETAKEYYTAVKSLKADSKLQPGSYTFKTLSDPENVVKQLCEGPNAGVKLTIPEGLTVKQVAAKVEAATGISADDFLAQAKASNYQDSYSFLKDVADDSLEGFLCPKTYTLSDSQATADGIITAMLDQYQTEYASLDFDSARAAIKTRYGLDMSDYDLLILSSVVEREALTDDQRYNVASTFYNRLKQDMALQSDAVMGYVTGGEVSASDLKTESPYNTYLNKGLPPTPICSPSMNSLKATLEPADTNYLYFFITSDNEYFSETYDQHLQAIEENK